MLVTGLIDSSPGKLLFSLLRFNFSYCCKPYQVEVTMSYKALPLLFINLGGEMVYILHQRLNAQSIDSSKAQKGDTTTSTTNNNY